jgi:hypothetical protein
MTCVGVTDYFQVCYIANNVVQGKLHAFLRDLTSVSYNQVLLNKK